MQTADSHTPDAMVGQRMDAHQRSASHRSSGLCHTPQECATMMDAVEQAMQHAQECTPDSHPAQGVRARNLQEWLRTSGLQMPTPAAKDLQALVEAAADNRRLRRQLEALREAELELAAREAEETALNFSMLEEENVDLASRNAQLQQRIVELEVLAEAAEAAVQAQQQQQQQQLQPCASPEPCTPQHQCMKATALGEDGADMQERATSVLKRAAAASRLSGMYEEDQQAKLRQLSEAEGRLSAMKSQAPASTHSQHSAMQQRLSAAEQQVQEAAAAAQEATKKLQAVLQAKEEVQEELAALRQQLEAHPNAAAQHAELYTKLLEAQQQLLQEKQHHQQVAGSLLEHAGRLSHKYYNLSDDYDALEHRYHQLTRANDHLSRQLKEAHEALYDVQTAIQATPVHKRRQQQHLLSRLQDAEQAVMSLAHDKQQLQERLMQAQAFIACLQRRANDGSGAAGGGAAAADARQGHQAVLLQTPTDAAAARSAAASLTPGYSSDGISPAGAAYSRQGPEVVLALPAPPSAAAGSSDGSAASGGGQHHAVLRSPPMDFATPAAKGHSATLLDQAATLGSQLVPAQAGSPHAAAAAFVPQACLTLPEDPVSPILAAAARTTTEGEERRHLHRTAAHEELQDVQEEQLGLRQEISRAKSALADIAGQLRASIGAPPSTHQAGGSSHSAGRSLATASAASAVRSASSSSSRGQRLPHDRSASVVSGAHDGSSSSKSSGSRSKASSEGDRHSQGSSSRLKAPAGCLVVPAKLQQLQKAAAAVKLASAARSGGSSSSKGSATASRAAAPESSFTFPDTKHAPDARGGPAGAAPRRAVSQMHWDQLSDSDSSPDSRPYRNPVSSAGARAAPAAAPLAGTTEQTAASLYGGGGSNSSSCVKSAPAAGATSGSASGKGSISLGQLIADAESVSLEYGMSPQGGLGVAGDAPAATDGAAAGAAASQPTPDTSHYSRAGGAAALMGSGTPWQQQEQFAFAAQEPVATPGSAASSAGAGAGRLLHNRHSFAHGQQFEQTPMSAAVGARPIAEDLQSCKRGARAAGYSSTAGQQPARLKQQTPSAATPVGLERVASSSALDDFSKAELAPPQMAAAGPTQLQLQGQPDAASGVANVGATTDKQAEEGCSSVQHQDAAGQAVTPSATAGSAVAAGAWSGDATPAHKEGDASRVAAPSSAVVQQQQQETTPVKSSIEVKTPEAAVCSPPSALKKAAAALLSSISPAGLVAQGTPEAAIMPGAAAAAAAGLSPQLLQHLTPEWLRSLKRKCKQESEQLQLLRKQMGLLTPEGQLLSPQQQQQQQQEAPSAAVTTTTAAPRAEEAAGSRSDEFVGRPALAADDSCRSIIRDGLMDDGSNTLSMQTTPGDSAVAAAATAANMSSSSTRAGTVTAAAGTRSSLGQLSSRNSLGRLRRRAIMAHAKSAASPLPDESDVVHTAATAASQVCGGGCVGAAFVEDDLDRSSSAGSLADYMQQHIREEATAASRAGSFTPGMLPARPECPTPGSVYSDVQHALSSADDALSGRDSPVSPDLLLAGLRSSRMAARQLQQQLMQQLEKTNSMPAMLTERQDSMLALHMTASAAADVAGAGGAASSVGGGDQGSSCASPALAATSELQALPQEAGAALQPTDTQATEVPAGDALQNDGISDRQGQQEHQEGGQPAEQQLPTASPITPGAALNAGAESRLLSPSAQLQLVFDDSEDEKEASAAAAGRGVEQQPCPSTAQSARSSTMQDCHARPQHSPQAVAESPQVTDCSSSYCMLPLGIAAKPLPADVSAVAAPSPPGSAMTVTPGFSGPVPPGSIRAHQLSSVAAGTVTASMTPHAHGATDEPQSCARAPEGSAGARAHSSAGVTAEAAAGLQPLQSAGAQASLLMAASAGAAPSSSSTSRSTHSAGGPSLGSWAAGSVQPSAAAQTPGSAASSRERPAATAPAGGSNSLTSAQATKAGLPIVLGESPSNSQRATQARTHSHGSSTGNAASAVWGVGAATPGSTSITSDSCLSGSQCPGLPLGPSPCGSDDMRAEIPLTSATPAAAGRFHEPASSGRSVPGGACSSSTREAPAGASAAAGAAAFAAPQVAAGRVNGATAAAAASSSTWGSGSCMFATPAAAFNSPGGTYGAHSGSSNGREYYTGLQGSSISSSRCMGTTAATGKQGTEGHTEADPGEAFAGFRVGDSYASGNSPASAAAMPGSRPPPAAADVVAGTSAGVPAAPVTATAQKRLLQQLLGSPTSPADVDDMLTADEEAADMLFVAGTPASTKQQQQSQNGARQSTDAAAAADLTVLSFEQRLELLCAEDGCDAAEGGAEGVRSTAQLMSPAGSTDTGVQTGPLALDGGNGSTSSSKQLPYSSMACCGTQTSPLPGGMNAGQAPKSYRETGVQVPTPAPQRPEAKQPTPISSAAVSTTKADEASRARRCDVSASPIKGRDQL